MIRVPSESEFCRSAMAIINTFDKCLDSPYLFRDSEAPSQVLGLLAQADDQLAAARDLLESPKPDPTDVGTLAYQAMFAAVRALVYARGYREAGLKCLVLACEGLYVRPGLLDGGELVAFERVQGFKLPAAEAVAAASTLLGKAKVLVGTTIVETGRP